MRLRRRPEARGLALVFAAILLASALSACGVEPLAQRGPVSGQVTRARTTNQLTYVAIGASDAFGVGTEDPDRESWPTQLAARLGDRVHLVNLGIPGSTVEQAVLDELPVALDAKPDVVTVWMGVNDLLDGVTLDDYAQQLGSLLAAVKSGTRARIAVGNLPDLTLLPRFGEYRQDVLRAEIVQWNARIRELCLQNHVTLVDIYSG